MLTVFSGTAKKVSENAKFLHFSNPGSMVSI